MLVFYVAFNGDPPAGVITTHHNPKKMNFLKINKKFKLHIRGEKFTAIFKRLSQMCVIR